MWCACSKWYLYTDTLEKWQPQKTMCMYECVVLSELHIQSIGKVLRRQYNLRTFETSTSAINHHKLISGTLFTHTRTHIDTPNILKHLLQHRNGSENERCFQQCFYSWLFSLYMGTHFGYSKQYIQMRLSTCCSIHLRYASMLDCFQKKFMKWNFQA